MSGPNFDARIGHGRRYSARVDFGHGPQSVNLNRYTVVPA